MKKIFFTCIASLLCITCFAQYRILTGTGVTLSPRSTKYINIGDGSPTNTSVYAYDLQVFGINAFFYPRYQLKQAKPGRGENFKPVGITIGAPLMLGAGFGFGQTAYTYSFYGMIDANVGSMNSNFNNKRFGAFAGIGFGIQNTNIAVISNLVATNKPVDTRKYKTMANNGTPKGIAMNYGPAIHAGFEFPGIFYSGTKSGLRIALQPAINKQGPMYYTVCLLQTLGARGGYGYRL